MSFSFARTVYLLKLLPQMRFCSWYSGVPAHRRRQCSWICQCSHLHWKLFRNVHLRACGGRHTNCATTFPATEEGKIERGKIRPCNSSAFGWLTSWSGNSLQRHQHCWRRSSHWSIHWRNSYRSQLSCTTLSYFRSSRSWSRSQGLCGRWFSYRPGESNHEWLYDNFKSTVQNI